MDIASDLLLLYLALDQSCVSLSSCKQLLRHYPFHSQICNMFAHVGSLALPHYHIGSHDVKACGGLKQGTLMLNLLKSADLAYLLKLARGCSLALPHHHLGSKDVN